MRRNAVASPRQVPAHTPSYTRQVVAADALRREGAYTDALQAFHAIALAFPNRSDASNNLAGMLQACGHPDHALRAVSRALELDPNNVAALLNSAEILKDFGDWETVAQTYDAALSLAPASPDIRFARALHLLMIGRWAEGWREHEVRSQVPGLMLRRSVLTSPVWDGSVLDGRRILLDHEQGLGDQIMCARFVADVAARGGQVTIRCSAPLATLFAAIDGVDAVSIEGSAVPPHDVHASLMSLPALLGVTSAETLSGAAYLRPVGQCPDTIRDALSTDAPKIGLVWAGNPRHRNDARRSLSPALLAPLLALDGVQFVALQPHDAQTQLPASLRGGVLDLGAALGTFNDTAHALLRLDLLITVDTAMAHLAGALGVPVLLLVPFVPDWRWMVDRLDAPWYRSVRLLRQTRVFEWESVVLEARDRVAALAGAGA
jgi:Tetratricopeptide repeat